MLSAQLAALNIEVKLFSKNKLQSCIVSIRGGGYSLVGLNPGKHDDTLVELHPEGPYKSLAIKQSGTQVSATYGTKNSGNHVLLLLVPNSEESHFIIKAAGPERIYNGSLRLRVYKNELQIVNGVELEDYVAGVVESEGGHYAQYEYFKAQAVLARTWVLKNIDKHKKEGYHVRDDESSQVYKSMAYLQYCSNIVAAVYETRDTILTDANGKAIVGAFHSNSGGQTLSSEDYWNEKIDYLRSVKDTFSLSMDKAFWEKRLNKEEFVEFVAGKLGVSAKDEVFRNNLLNFKQAEREAYFEYLGKRIKLRYIRDNFKLRSTFFDVIEEANTVLLKGRGFGHGVGMSQEGAMRMSELGYCYHEILAHYFKDARLNKIQSL